MPGKYVAKVTPVFKGNAFRDSFHSYTLDYKCMFNLINGTWALSHMYAFGRNQILWIMNEEGI